MKKMLFLFLGLILACNSQAFNNKYDTVIVFGDSLSDNGNLYQYLMHYMPASPPYANGRFSNGKLWVEHLFTEAFGDKNKQGFKDYAIGGAGAILDSKGATPYTLDSEINDYLYINTYGKKDSSLYVIWIGANNYLGSPSDVDGISNKVTSAINSGVEKLIKNGANKFLIVNLPDLGRLPAAAKYDKQELLTRLALAHNQKLAAKVAALKMKYPKVHLAYFDVYAFFNEAVMHHTDYGLTNITDACYKGEYTGYRIQSPQPKLEQQFPKLSTEQITMMQSNPLLLETARQTQLSGQTLRLAQSLQCDTYLFWDYVHPTANVHRFIGQQAKMVLDDEGFQPIIH